jgi:hypothetical protein
VRCLRVRRGLLEGLADTNEGVIAFDLEKAPPAKRYVSIVAAQQKGNEPPLSWFPQYATPAGGCGHALR